MINQSTNSSSHNSAQRQAQIQQQQAQERALNDQRERQRQEHIQRMRMFEKLTNYQKALKKAPWNAEKIRTCCLKISSIDLPAINILFFIILYIKNKLLFPENLNN